MNKYIVTIPQADEHNAGPKARRDVETLAVRAGYRPIAFTGERTTGGSAKAMLRVARDAVRNWRRLEKEVAPGSLVLVQYPHYPVKTAYLMDRVLPGIRRRKQVRFVALIHDLNSLRKMFGSANVHADKKTLHRFDAWVCHNERMRDWMIAHGFPAERVIPLTLFDYLTQEAMPANRTNDGGVAVAGNLAKSGYLRGLAEHLPAGISLHLYGVGFSPEDAHPGVTYHGSFSPETLPGRLTGAFGLVWDGGQMDTCAGVMGEYMRLNDPHKASLYLASGMPIIVWKQAAVAPWLQAQGVAVTVDSLADIGEAVAAVSPEDYAIMRQKAAALGRQLRDGAMFLAADKAVTALWA